MKKTLMAFIILFSFELYAQDILKFSDAEFEFCLKKECEETNCKIPKIEVLKNGILKQTIIPSENYFSHSFPTDQLFYLEDMNFDGKKDFRLMKFLPAGPNVPFLFWIYNPTNELFEINTDYDDITSPEFDYEKKEINSTWRDGCCKHGRDIYKLINGIPTLTERFVIGHDSEDKEFFEHWKVVNGEFKLIKKSDE